MQLQGMPRWSCHSAPTRPLQSSQRLQARAIPLALVALQPPWLHPAQATEEAAASMAHATTRRRQALAGVTAAQRQRQRQRQRQWTMAMAVATVAERRAGSATRVHSRGCDQPWRLRSRAQQWSERHRPLGRTRQQRRRVQRLRRWRRAASAGRAGPERVRLGMQLRQGTKMQPLHQRAPRAHQQQQQARHACGAATAAAAAARRRRRTPTQTSVASRHEGHAARRHGRASE